MLRVEHPIEFDLDTCKGEGHVVTSDIIPTVAVTIGTVWRARTTATNVVFPTIAYIVKLIGACTLDAIIDRCYLELHRLLRFARSQWKKSSINTRSYD